MRLGWGARPTLLHDLQAAAAVGQSILVQSYETAFKRHGIVSAQVLLGHDDVIARDRYLNARGTLNTLLSLGVEGRFWMVAQKPGKPLFFGTRGRTLVFGLPGNPVSSFICFMEYLWPTLRKMQGRSPSRKIRAVLATPFPRDPHRHRFLFGRVLCDGGILRVDPTTRLGSHMLTAALRANCILEAPPGEGPLDVGEEVSLQLLPWGELEPLERA